MRKKNVKKTGKQNNYILTIENIVNDILFVLKKKNC